MDSTRILVKLRPSASLKAAEGRTNLRPLHEGEGEGAFALSGEERWFLAELPEGAATPWDTAHARVAEQLGVAESDVVFAEPDLIHDVYLDPSRDGSNTNLAAVGVVCPIRMAPAVIHTAVTIVEIRRPRILVAV